MPPSTPGAPSRGRLHQAPPLPLPSKPSTLSSSLALFPPGYAPSTTPQTPMDVNSPPSRAGSVHPRSPDSAAVEAHGSKIPRPLSDNEDDDNDGLENTPSAPPRFPPPPSRLGSPIQLTPESTATPSAPATPDLDLVRLIPHACFPMATLYGLGILENSLPVIDAGQGMGALTILGQLMTSLASVVTPPTEVQRFWAEGRAAPSFQQYVASHPEQAAATIVATVGQAMAAFSLLEEQFRTWGDEARAGSRAAVLASFLGATQLGRTGPFRSESDQLSLLQSELTRMSSEQTSLAAAVQALATQGQPRAGQPAVHFANRASDPTGNPNSGPRPTPMVMDPPAHPAPPVPAQTPSSGWTTVSNKRARPRTLDRPNRPPSHGQKRPKPANKDKGKGRTVPAPAPAAPPAPAPASGTAPAPTYAAATAAGQPSAPAAPTTSPTTPTPDKPKPKVEVAQRFKTPTLTLFAEGLDRLVSTSSTLR